MKTIIIIVGICFLSIAALSGTGTLSFTQGKVFLTQANKAEKKARRGNKINPGDTIRTDSGGLAKITMADKNIIHIGPKTEMLMAEYVTENEGAPSASLDVLYGKVRTTLTTKYDGKKSRFRVNTRAAILGVRGTDFLTEYNQEADQTRATAFEGIVSVSGLGPDGKPLGGKKLTAGQMTLISFGSKPLAPVNLPADIVEQFNQGSKAVKDKDSKKTTSLKSNVLQTNQQTVKNFDRMIPDNIRERSRRPIPKQFVDRNFISKGIQSKVKITVEAL